MQWLTGIYVINHYIFFTHKKKLLRLSPKNLLSLCPPPPKKIILGPFLPLSQQYESSDKYKKMNTRVYNSPMKCYLVTY